ncbi:unnamed protein product [Schistosoma curassoni]|uniref:Uncharacterized protein n=1 Tax=Schistosoma curassoni TaxID=6186 RepID=A0A183KEU1_9TREM|nr:unnamed protein product [Schistosoma curassoni]
MGEYHPLQSICLNDLVIFQCREDNSYVSVSSYCQYPKLTVTLVEHNYETL